MNRPIDQLTKALTVMVTDKKIRSFLQENDPMALKQAQEALRDYFNQFEEEQPEDQMNDFNWVGSKWHY
ncbi:MAG: hypothetical protein EBU30_03255 [Synechococcaceae bacterium WB6_3B_236]|nr:hypothetical protein [Synechococcaceae bacterium WB6_3B_236]